ncbi:pseudouridylate synthase [Staphylococcus gallinarum]|uniref:Pseudouridylate synthase n=1 Tax=Staphylococcus gallinarum TaxID=1293 RepID=A0A380FEI7_STAGA|nr:pseudouridylate synthase [Staphylococcus gallinarum]
MIMVRLMLQLVENKNDRQSMDVVDDGKEAVTHFNV